MTQSATGRIQPINNQKPSVTAPRIAFKMKIATAAIATVIPKFRASLPSTLDFEPRSLKTSQMMSGTRSDRMFPKWAKDAHCLSSASVRGSCGAAGCGVVLALLAFR
jgi:hypothetical protein